MQSIIDEIDPQLVPKYRNYYVSYKQLLESVHLLKEREDGIDTSSSSLIKGLMLPKDFAFGDTTAMFGFVEQRPEVRFVSLLQHEVSKLNHFSQLEIKTMLATLRQLDRKLTRILSHDDIDVSLSRKAFPSATDEAELAMSTDEKIRNIFERLMSVADEMLILEQYTRLNITIFKKVITEFDREFSPPVGSWFVANLSKEPFANIPFDGLFTIVSRLCANCGGPERISDATSFPVERPFSVSSAMTLRAKLTLVSVTDLLRPVDIPQNIWDSFAIPLRSEDLNHESMQSSTSHVRIVLPSSHESGIISISLNLPLTIHGGGALIERVAGQEQTLSIEELGIIPDADVTLTQYDEIRFNRARMVENIRFRKGLFSFAHVFGRPHTDTIDVDRGFLGEVIRRQSVESTQSTAENFSRYTRISSNIIFVSSEYVQARISDLITPISVPFSINDLCHLTPVPTPPATESLGSSTPPILPIPVPSPLLSTMHPAHPPLPYSSPTLKAAPQAGSQGGAAPVMIHPKNFMANERSLLAWISATSVQSGIGLALLGKEGLSFIGAILCLISLTFLWWSIFVFVKRFRQLRTPDPNNAHVFYSMEQCTVFGLTQLVLLLIQSLVFIWS